MENQEVHSQADELKNTYTVVQYAGRRLPAQYRPLIYSSFLRSLRHGNSLYKLIDRDCYFNTYKALISHLLLKDQSVVRLAVLSDDLDVVLGWSLYENTMLHYVYVNKDNRKMGIATSLTPTPFTSISHLTTAGMSIWASKFNNNPAKPSNKPLVIFNPFFT